MRKKERSVQGIESLIASGVEIKGDIVSQGSIRVDGYVEGNLDIKADLILGEKGKLKGEAKAQNLIIAGRLEGKANAGACLEIAATGAVIGDISAAILIIDEGGLLDGNSRMTRAKPDKSDKERTHNLKEDQLSKDN